MNMKLFKNLLLITAMISTMAMIGCGDDEDDPSGAVTASAGADQTITLGQTANLNGTGTDTGGGTLTYLWEIDSRPAGSTVFISNPLVASTSFVPDAAGIFVLELTVVSSTGQQATDQVTITVEQGTVSMTPLEIRGTINTDSVLTKIATTGADYLVTGTVTMNAQLTIAPGVIIEFADNQGLAIGTQGTLVAVGTTTNPIVLTGQQKSSGFWKGIELESNNVMNEITFVTVEYGGSGGFDGANLLSNLVVQESGKVKITNSNFTNSAGYGIYTRSLESELPEFTNNTLTDNEAPIMTRINHYHYFDASSDYSGNTDDYIDSYWSNQDVTEDVTWNALNVPFRLANNVEEIISDLVVSPGFEMIAQPNSGIEVVNAGSMSAVGTMTDPIIFRGEQDVDGYWKGLLFGSNNTDNELTYVNISNGGEEGFDGANLKTNIMVEGSGRVKITNTTSSKSGGYGLYTRSLESALPDFADNTFTENDAPVMTRINHYHFYDSNSDYTGNTDDYIDSYWSNSDVTENVTWQALNVPFRMANNVEEIVSDVVINAGAQFLGQPNGGLEVNPGGSMTANGTAGAPVIFEGEQNVTGYWKGLRFLSNTTDNDLDNVIVSNGGEEGFDGGNRKANIEVGASGRLNLTNSTISLSGGFGVRIQSGGTFTSSGITYSGNISGNTQND